MNNEGLSAKFRTRQRKTSNIVRYKKRKYIQNIMNRVKSDDKIHRIWDMYMRVNNLKGGHIKKKRFLRNGNGSLITTSEELTKN